MECRHKFVSLQTGMKGIITKVTALLLIVWYSMSIIGFDIHTCSGSGESFVVTFVEGFECEDIHPEHHCAEGRCCSHSYSCCETVIQDCVHSKSCCSRDYQVLSLTGAVSDEKNGFEDLGSFIYCNLICSNIPDFNAGLYNLSHMSRRTTFDSCPWHMSDIQSVLNVWRI